MKFRQLIPMLRTWQMDASIAFYTEVLGFRCESSREGWAALRRDDVEIMLSQRNSHAGGTAPAFTGSLYIEVQDVDALWLELKDKAQVCYPLEQFDYGMREFCIYDNNGYLIQFGQEVAISEAAS